jgi:hypothetical protein
MAKMFQAMAKKSGYCVRLSYKQSNSDCTRLEANNGTNNIEGILTALRYLSIEAEGAGLFDLANSLQDTASEYDIHFINATKDCKQP